GSGAPGQGDNPGGTATVAPGLLQDLLGGPQIAPLLPGRTIDINGDGQPDAGVFALPLKSADFDASTKTGMVNLDGGISLLGPNGSGLMLDNSSVVIGPTADTSGLYADVNGVRLKVGDLDTDNLNLDVANGTVNLSGLNATVSGALALLLQPIL